MKSQNKPKKPPIMSIDNHLVEESRTFGEYLLSPGLTTKECIPDKVSLETFLTKYSKKDASIKPLKLNIPVTSAIMQAVSDDNLAVALAKQGGLSFIYGSQTIEDQCEMVSKVKKYKAGFVTSDSNLKATDTLDNVLDLKAQKGHSTIPITDNGKSNGKLLGLVTSRDYRIGYIENNTPISKFMTPMEKLICGKSGISLSQANAMIWEHKLNVLPIIDKKGNLESLVFRKDYDQHVDNRNELLDDQKRFMVGAGINTRDYEQRIPALVAAGVDVLCIDSSDGYSEYAKDVISFVRKKYGNDVKIGAGNVVAANGFEFLAAAGADFIKVGIGGGSICITREQKGIGCGQATAVMEVSKTRDLYFKKTGIYIPICSDGGIVTDNNVTMALAMGADFVMMGRYFARFEEAPGAKVIINGTPMKEYWGEGSNKAQNWQRYDIGGKNSLKFEEGVDSYVPFAGGLKENLEELIYKTKSTMCNCGCLDLSSFRKDSVKRPVSQLTLREGSAHDVLAKDSK